MLAQAGQEQAGQKVTTMLTTFQSPKQVLDLKDRPRDRKPYTINNLLGELVLPLRGNAMAGAIDWGNPRCDRAPARSGDTQVLQEYTQHLIPTERGGGRLRKESLPLPS